MGATTIMPTITICLAVILTINPNLAANSRADDSVEVPIAYAEEPVEPLIADEVGEGARTWETAWIFAGSAEPDPTGPYDDPIPEDPIP